MMKCWLLLTCMLLASRSAVSATRQELDKWKGCYEIEMTKMAIDAHEPFDASSLRHYHVQLGTDLVPATAGAYSVFVSELAEDRNMSQWWPVDDDSFLLAVGDGFVGWSATLKRTGSQFEARTKFVDDTGKTSSNWHVVANRVACKPSTITPAS